MSETQCSLGLKREVAQTCLVLRKRVACSFNKSSSSAAFFKAAHNSGEGSNSAATGRGSAGARTCLDSSQSIFELVAIEQFLDLVEVCCCRHDPFQKLVDTQSRASCLAGGAKQAPRWSAVVAGAELESLTSGHCRGFS